MVVSPSVFLSYPSTDRLIAGLIYDRLQAVKIETYWDPHLNSAEKFDHQLREKINHSTVVLALWTEGAFQRDWVKKEAEIALEQGKLVPLLYRIPMEQIKKEYLELHYIQLDEWNATIESDCFRDILQQVQRVSSLTVDKTRKKNAKVPIKRKDGKLVHQLMPIKMGQRIADHGCPEMVIVEPTPRGYYYGTMPAEADRDRDSTKHERPERFVSIPYAFAVGKYPVTYDDWEWAAKQKDGPKYIPAAPWGRGKKPVVNVSWLDALDYIEFLRRHTDLFYRLLTETEWEYVCRAGRRGPFAFDPMSLSVTRYDARGVCANSIQKLDHKPNKGPGHVTSCPPNDFGVCGMHGNVWEWVEDHWADDHSSKPVDGQAWVKPRATNRSPRVIRGGCYKSLPQHIRSAHRRKEGPRIRSDSIGFRVARDLLQSENTDPRV